MFGAINYWLDSFEWGLCTEAELSEFLEKHATITQNMATRGWP